MSWFGWVLLIWGISFLGFLYFVWEAKKYLKHSLVTHPLRTDNIPCCMGCGKMAKFAAKAIGVRVKGFEFAHLHAICDSSICREKLDQREYPRLVILEEIEQSSFRYIQQHREIAA